MSLVDRILWDKNYLLDKQHELTVRGVYQDTPENTAYHFDFVAPIYAGGGYIGGWNMGA